MRGQPADPLLDCEAIIFDVFENIESTHHVERALPVRLRRGRNVVSAGRYLSEPGCHRQGLVGCLQSLGGISTARQVEKQERNSGMKGKGVSVSVDLDGRR